MLTLNVYLQHTKKKTPKNSFSPLEKKTHLLSFFC